MTERGSAEAEFEVGAARRGSSAGGRRIFPPKGRRRRQAYDGGGAISSDVTSVASGRGCGCCCSCRKCIAAVVSSHCFPPGCPNFFSQFLLPLPVAVLSLPSFVQSMLSPSCAALRSSLLPSCPFLLRPSFCTSTASACVRTSFSSYWYIAVTMENNEDDALDLLLSLQSDDPIVHSSPLPEVDERSGSNSDSGDVVEIGGISLRKLGASQQRVASLPTVKTCAQKAGRSPPNTSSTPVTDPDTGYYSDESYERPKRNVTMAAFRDVVKDSLEKPDSSTIVNINRPNPTGKLLPCNQVDVDQHSGLRIRDRLVSSATLNSRFCDLKFVRLQAIKLAGMAANFKGEWATVGALAEKGQPKLSAAGKNFAIWKLASLDGAVISVFVFGDAYSQNWKESAGAVFAIFRAKVRLDEKSKQPSLSIFNANQLLKIGSSADFAVCKGKRVGGGPCSMVVNRRLQGDFCQHHLGAAYQKIKTKRAEISGGNLATAFSGPGTKRAQTVKAIPKSPLKEVKYTRPIKQLNSIDLRRVLSTPEKVTSNVHSQGMRFLETRSRHHYDQEQKLETLKKKATIELSGTRKKARVPLVEKLVNKSTLENSQEPTKANFVELDIDEIDDDMEQARLFFSSQGPQGSKAK